jgi:Lanthionine synthetase C-like protein/Protein kinase domain
MRRGQGWKLHISGTVLSAEEILARTLPVLLSCGCAFKVTRNLAFLEALSAANAPRESAGKFITIYPADDETCGALAGELDALLTGIHGPVVLSDLPYRPASLVSCRYGAFTAMYTLSAAGAIRPAIRTPDGALVEDRRRAWFECPPWTSPPAAFRRPVRVTSGVSEPASQVREPSNWPGQVLLADRFLVIQALRLTAKGGVYLARDLAAGQLSGQESDAGHGDDNRGGHLAAHDLAAHDLAAHDLVVIKQARPHIGLGADGMDARSFLLNEWSVLHLMAGAGVTPSPVGLFQHDGDLFMAGEFLGGTRLDRWARRYQPGPYRTGFQTGGSDVALLTALERLCDSVDEFHSRGLVIRDLSPTNLIVSDGADGDPAGVAVRICDVEYVAFSGTAPRLVGTHGFNPPEQRAGKAVQPASDRYALGALLYYICTGEAPLLARDDPPGRPTAARMSELLSSCAPSRPLAAMTGLIVALLADDPAERPSLADIREQLRRALRPSAAGGPVRAGACPQSGKPAAQGAGTGDGAARTRELTAGLAAGLVAHLIATWEPCSPRPWNFADYGRHEAPLDVYSGVAGVIGVLAQAAATGDYPGAAPVLTSAADWLKDRYQHCGAARPGLMVGDSGIAWALGLARAATHRSGPDSRARDGALTTEIMARVRSACPSGSVPTNDDFLYGTAGAIVAHSGLLQAADVFGLAPADIGAIRDQFAVLCAGLAARQAPGAPGALGATDRGGEYSTAETTELVTDHGFAHGMAGIGYGFLMGGVTSGDKTLIGHALRYGQRIIEAASYAGDQAWWQDGSTRSPLFRAHWCHGSSGVATFLIRLWWFTGEDAALAVARDAARAVLAGRAGAPACMCHGLAGDGELLLDLAAATAEPQYTRAAWSVASQLLSMRVRREGRWLVPDEKNGSAIGVDYGVGSSGVAAFFLRLLHGGRRPWMADDVPYGPKRAGFPAFSTEQEGR